MVSEETFVFLVENAPLGSVDLIIENGVRDILLGERVKRSARRFRFVLGGLIFKSKTIEEVFSRVASSELWFYVSFKSSKLNGAFVHTCSDSHLSECIGTHYVAISFSFKAGPIETISQDRHSACRWFNVEQHIASEIVHENNKQYLRVAR